MLAVEKREFKCVLFLFGNFLYRRTEGKERDRGESHYVGLPNKKDI
jgi:hypothetical protein